MPFVNFRGSSSCPNFFAIHFILRNSLFDIRYSKVAPCLPTRKVHLAICSDYSGKQLQNGWDNRSTLKHKLCVLASNPQLCLFCGSSSCPNFFAIHFILRISLFDIRYPKVAPGLPTRKVRLAICSEYFGKQLQNGWGQPFYTETQLCVLPSNPQLCLFCARCVFSWLGGNSSQKGSQRGFVLETRPVYSVCFVLPLARIFRLGFFSARNN